MVVVKKYLLTTFGVPSAGNVKDGGMHPLFISLSCIRNTYLRVKLIKLVCVCVCVLTGNSIPGRSVLARLADT